MAVDLSTRVYDAEWMDDPAVDPGQLAKSLRYIRLVNRAFNGTRATLIHLRRMLQRAPRNQPVTVLDVGTGSADIPRAMRRWGRRGARDIRVVALDLHTGTLADAARLSGDSGVQLVRADALRLPIADRSVDIVHAAMFLHHFREPEIIRMLTDFDRVARLGIIINDLRRTRAAWWGAVLSTVSGPEIVRHDARLSIRRAFTRAEAEHLAAAAGLPWLRYRRHFGFRFCLAGTRHAGQL